MSWSVGKSEEFSIENDKIYVEIREIDEDLKPGQPRYEKTGFGCFDLSHGIMKVKGLGGVKHFVCAQDKCNFKVEAAFVEKIVWTEEVEYETEGVKRETSSDPEYILRDNIMVYPSNRTLSIEGQCTKHRDIVKISHGNRNPTQILTYYSGAKTYGMLNFKCNATKDGDFCNFSTGLSSNSDVCYMANPLNDWINTFPDDHPPKAFWVNVRAIHESFNEVNEKVQNKELPDSRKVARVQKTAFAQALIRLNKSTPKSPPSKKSTPAPKKKAVKKVPKSVAIVQEEDDEDEDEDEDGNQMEVEDEEGEEEEEVEVEEAATPPKPKKAKKNDDEMLARRPLHQTKKTNQTKKTQKRSSSD